MDFAIPKIGGNFFVGQQGVAQAFAQEPAGQGRTADAIHEIGLAALGYPVRHLTFGDPNGYKAAIGINYLFAAKIVLKPGGLDFPAESRGFAVALVPVEMQKQLQ